MVKIMARPFTGQEDENGFVEDPGRWVDHYNIVSLSNNWLDDDAKIRNFPVFLHDEAADWYDGEREWIGGENRTWAEVVARFVARFRPVDFLEEIEERLRTPAQKVNESVRGYAGRYDKLRRQTENAAMTADACLRWWISGLRLEIKEDVLMSAPANYQAALRRAIRRETVINTLKKDDRKVKEGKRPKPEETQRLSDAVKADGMADMAEGSHRSKKEVAPKAGNNKEAAPEDDPKFVEFYKEMSPKIEKGDPSVDELVAQYKAWKLYSKVCDDKDKVKVKILKMSVASGGSKKSSSAGGRACYHCEETGHMSRDCPKKPTRKCFGCGEEGHLSWDCPNKAEGSKSAGKKGDSDPKGKKPAART